MNDPLGKARLFLKGRLRHALSDQEAALLDSVIDDGERVPDGYLVQRRAVPATHSTLLLDGFIARVIDDGGTRNIVSVQVPGDFVDLHAFALKRLDHDVVTIGPALLGSVAHEKLAQIVRDEPHLTRVLWFSTLLDAAIHREWILKLEQLKAEERLGHIMCELWHRLNFVGLADAHGFNMPLLQTHLANACGTTAVHINRVIKAVRQRGLLEINRGRVTMPDRPALERFSHFKPDYLYGHGSLFLSEDLREP
ncbi:Crp/Fnr family transcriptional regulator [Novosphingobium sp. 9U]|uniref:Crp/Fnr family transcriptional regulator n=1 Tax=Novosphingobium sp. 9U TaxID=2653158 RepID=UPI0012F259AF|nr:Crp/Fnr family transcriptional regulator [Novosphingobium sp. 9U]VWX53088.1 Transcriptional regulator [Novosphingobium sp. 9U]